jgi:hypothetical protein
VGPSRAALERRVDELAAAHSGQEFADAVAAYAQGLDVEARAELEAILLQRARALEDAVSERFEAKGWLRRTVDRMSQPPGNRPRR